MSFDWLHKDVVNNPSFLNAYIKEYSKLNESKPIPRDHHVSIPPTSLEAIEKELHPYFFDKSYWNIFLENHHLTDPDIKKDINSLIKMLIDGGELKDEAEIIIKNEIIKGSILGRALELTSRFETTLIDHWFNTFEKRKQKASSDFNQKWRGEDHDLYVSVYGPDLIEARKIYLKKKNLEDPPKVILDESQFLLQGHFSYEEGKPYSEIRNEGFMVLGGGSVETDFPGQIFMINYDLIKIPNFERERRYDKQKKQEEFNIPIPEDVEVSNIKEEFPFLEKEEAFDAPPNKIKPFVEKQFSSFPFSSKISSKEYIKPGEAPPPGVVVFRGPRGGHYFIPPKKKSVEDQRGAKFTLETSKKEADSFFGEGGSDFLADAYAVDIPGYSTKITYAGHRDPIKPSWSSDEAGNFLYVMINIYGDDHKKVGSMLREFNKTNKDLEVNHREFKLDESHRGKGIASSISQNTEEAYRKAGIRKIKLLAGDVHGGYAWAVQGYDFDPEFNDKSLVLSRFHKAIKSLAIRERLPQFEHIQKEFPAITVDEANRMIEEVNKMKHSWEFARYNPFNNDYGKHFGKAALRGVYYSAVKDLDPTSKSFKVGKAYFLAKNKLRIMGG